MANNTLQTNTTAPVRILVRLPNWVGDVVMSLGFISALRSYFPNAVIDVICKKGSEGIVGFIPGIHTIIPFSKTEFAGLIGLRSFSKKIKLEQLTYDYYFCLPNSFSSAYMGYAIGAKKRIGFKNELRSVFLTDSYRLPKKLHRVEEYLYLLNCSLPVQETRIPQVFFNLPKQAIEQHLVVNFNSEASSRRMPIAKAVAILETLLASFSLPLVLIGSPKDQPYLDTIEKSVDNNRIKNLAGTTKLEDLVVLLNNSLLLLSVDSGPSHLANALRTPVVVIHGADDENNTEAYNKEFVTGIRHQPMACAPCVKNKCPLYDEPECIKLISNQLIVATIQFVLDSNSVN
jgi:heptosyltransferase II